ncbi:hypothetical protein [Spiroplasma endosymbiont of Aleiodes alternator]|uniref:hypothetical protein n=1 Tax=Spiroplasma endosymbiont of Aleiodes alternator TaxID=3139329 RepID=UPI003CCACA9F
MINVNLDIKNKVRETTKGMLLEIGEYETWFSIKDTTINQNNKKITLKIIEDFNYKLGKKSITKDIESIKGSDILNTWIVNINGTNGTVFKIIVLSLLGFYKIVIFWV